MDDAELMRLLRHMNEYEPLGHDGWKAADRIEALIAERDALKADQIEAIRAALEAAAKCCVDTAKEALDDSYLTAWLSGLAYEIRALDPSAIAAKLKGECDEGQS